MLRKRLRRSSLQLSASDVNDTRLERTLRPSQIHHLNRVVTKSDVPNILAGDFNSTEEAELRLAAESSYQMALSAPRCPPGFRAG